MQSLSQLNVSLQCGQQTAASLVCAAIARAQDPSGEGRRVFLALRSDPALREAHEADVRRARGSPLPMLAGIPVSIKDVFDMRGAVSLAGSRLLRSAVPATRDSVVVSRLRAAGAILIGRTNMTEFAYSGLGINPHFGTPANPFDRQQGRIPGGSSSGAAVSVSDGMAAVAVGTDTGGSVRIPAALCGLTGFKATAARIPREGMLPLSWSLDSVGSIGWTVACCALLDAVLAGDPQQLPPPVPARELRLGAVMNYVLEGMDTATRRSYEQALAILRKSGIKVDPVEYCELDELPAINAKGGFAAYESYQYHRRYIGAHRDLYDPRVISRIERGSQMSEQEYLALQAQRDAFIVRSPPRFAGFHALLAPTVPIIAPTLTDCERDADYQRLNALVLRNPSIVNFLDGCGLSLPCHVPGEPPVGLMLFQSAHQDRRLIAVGRTLESVLNRELGRSGTLA